MSEQKQYYPTLSEVFWPSTSIARDITLIIAGSIFVALFAQLEIPLFPVPITGQTFAVLLVGALLGSKRGSLSILTYLTEGAAGLPVFAGGSFGIATFAGPTGGYLFSFVLAAYLVGWLCEKGWDRSIWSAIAAMLFGNLLILAGGTLWLSGMIGLKAGFTNGFIPFIPGMIAKLILGSVVLSSAWNLIGIEKSLKELEEGNNKP